MNVSYSTSLPIATEDKTLLQWALMYFGAETSTEAIPFLNQSPNKTSRTPQVSTFYSRTDSCGDLKQTLTTVERSATFVLIFIMSSLTVPPLFCESIKDTAGA